LHIKQENDLLEELCLAVNECDTQYLLNAVLFKDGNLAPVMTPCKITAIVRPSASLARLTFSRRHETQTNGILYIKTTAAHPQT